MLQQVAQISLRLLARWVAYFGRTHRQLVWWSAAAKEQRSHAIPTEAFEGKHSQRNAP